MLRHMLGQSIHISYSLRAERLPYVEDVGAIIIGWNGHLCDREEGELLPTRQRHRESYLAVHHCKLT